ncbi:PAS domain-containing sensor histidine kinase [Marinoscillum furvescens]|uniref:histidine kinase n=1 Tax=Marinoscillum furvescens DSM 4134 TaxID=1122208 RepID=A0A3D9LIK5_MARFU|nr:ATP-binding protein [Marinoscillum furvescens]REE05695.1 PAS domain S-box-containing protein [Marinoscillum furvescens DSM 4134]
MKPLKMLKQGLIWVGVLMVVTLFLLLFAVHQYGSVGESAPFGSGALLIVLSLGVLIGYLLLVRYVLRLFQQREWDQKKVENKLMAFDARLAAFIENPEHISIFTLDREYRYVYFNEIHAERIQKNFGSEVKQGASILSMLPEDLAHQISKSFNRALSGEHFTVTSRFEDRYYTQVYNPVYNDQGKVIGLTGNIADVTERIRAEQELEQYKDHLEEEVERRTKEINLQSQFFQSIIDSLPSLIFVRNEKGRYVMVNRAMANSLGVPHKEVLGESISETHKSVEDVYRYEQEDREILNDDIVVEEEAYYEFPDGTGHWLLLSKRRMLLGDEAYVLGIHVDITNLKDTEMKLLQANDEQKKTLNRLKQAQVRLVESEKMASLGQLTAGLAHEINNPINYVAGNVAPIRNDLHELKEYLEDMGGPQANGNGKTRNFDALFEELHSLLDGVDEGTTRVKNLMNDLNTFSMPAESRRYRYNINDSVRSTVNLVKHHVKGRIQINLYMGDVPSILCNPHQLNQVFLNILNNAIHAIKDEGVIDIRTSTEDAQISVAISDSGHGISSAHMKEIFDPFFTTKDQGEGTGLGLAISHRVITEHHGKIEVSSIEGKGSTFRIVLPVDQLGE